MSLWRRDGHASYPSHASHRPDIGRDVTLLVDALEELSVAVNEI